MPNSIRTPRPGSPQHIREAVDNEGWQLFRVSLKGRTTDDKLARLAEYLITGERSEEASAVQVRVDNYLKALARGGQIAVTRDYIGGLRGNTLTIRK